MSEVKEVIRKKAYSLDIAMWTVIDVARKLREQRIKDMIVANAKNAYVGTPSDEQKVWEDQLDIALRELDQIQNDIVRETSTAFREGDLKEGK